MTEPATHSPEPVTVGVAAESAPGERRVALVPKLAQRLTRRGLQVICAPGAGAGAGFSDEEFEQAGARIGDPHAARIVVRVAPPSGAEVRMLRAGTVLIGFLSPRSDSDRLRRLEAGGVTAFAMEAIPRISRAQAMDALSSQANVAGYRAVLMAALALPRFFPMLTTAAGTMKPAKVLVLGAGVAGLQALATAKRLGAQATGYDVRPEVSDQVRSVGARWLDLGIEAAGDGGYARELTEAERATQQRSLTEAITTFDVVVTTAQVPGRKAPILITTQAVRGMRPGSVIVDMAGETGGNCELTTPGAERTVHGVTIHSPLNLPAEMPGHASELYARNVVELLELLVDDESALRLDGSDAIIDGACVTGRDKLIPPQAGEDGKTS